MYFNVDPSPKFGLTLRTEYFNDKKSVLGFDGNIFATTLSANLKAGPLVFIPELRMENANKEMFAKKSGDGTKSTLTALFAAVYRF